MSFFRLSSQICKAYISRTSKIKRKLLVGYVLNSSHFIMITFTFISENFIGGCTFNENKDAII